MPKVSLFISYYYYTFVILDPPVITRSPLSVTVIQKGSAVFKCEVHETPNPTISWRRLDNSPLPRLRASVLLTNALKIVDIQPEDAGSYICQAKNVFGLEQAYATLAVQGITSVLSNKYIIRNKLHNLNLQLLHLLLKCLLTLCPCFPETTSSWTSGYPIPTITWSRVDDLPKSSKIEKNGTLILRNVTQSDLGQYICTAQNDIAKKTHSLTLTLDLKS